MCVSAGLSLLSGHWSNINTGSHSHSQGWDPGLSSTLSCLKQFWDGALVSTGAEAAQHSTVVDSQHGDGMWPDIYCTDECWNLSKESFKSESCADPHNKSPQFLVWAALCSNSPWVLCCENIAKFKTCSSDLFDALLSAVQRSYDCKTISVFHELQPPTHQLT